MSHFKPGRGAPIAERTAWVVVAPVEDVPGEWLAHCLDLNVMSQGRSLFHALDMIMEAVDLVLDEDGKAGLDPFDRTASAEDWAAFAEHMKHAELTTLEELGRASDEEDLAWMATKLTIPLPVENRKAGPTVRKVAQAAVQHAGTAA